MKHTKNILKSLLITVMALSLLAVSCSKDEGGSKPTNPTSITIDAATITAAIKMAGSTATITGATIDFDSLTINEQGKANLTATLSEAITLSTLKNELESGLTFTSGGATATAKAAANFPTDNSTSTAAVVNISIDAGNNTFADDVKYKDSKNNKKATVEITITPADSKKWNNT